MKKALTILIVVLLFSLQLQAQYYPVSRVTAPLINKQWFPSDLSLHVENNCLYIENNNEVSQRFFKISEYYLIDNDNTIQFLAIDKEYDKCVVTFKFNQRKLKWVSIQYKTGQIFTYYIT